jgi:hypothetical protein
MTIKDFKCKCGHNDFFFADKGSQKGIYCSYCGKWLKWADKDEQNLAMKQESTIKALGEELRKARKGIADEKVLIGYNMAVAICNKHLGESEVDNGNNSK